MHFYNTHPISHIRLTGSVVSVEVRTPKHDIHGKKTVSLEIDDGSGYLISCSFMWTEPVDVLRARYEKLMYKTVSVRGTPYSRFWDGVMKVFIDIRAVDTMDFVSELEALDNRMYTLEQLNVPPSVAFQREISDPDADIKFLDYEVMHSKRLTLFSEVASQVEILEKSEKSEKSEKLPGLYGAFTAAGSSRKKKYVPNPDAIVIEDDSEDDEERQEKDVREKAAQEAIEKARLAIEAKEKARLEMEAMEKQLEEEKLRHDAQIVDSSDSEPTSPAEPTSPGYSSPRLGSSPIKAVFSDPVSSPAHHSSSPSCSPVKPVASGGVARRTFSIPSPSRKKVNNETPTKNKRSPNKAKGSIFSNKRKSPKTGPPKFADFVNQPAEPKIFFTHADFKPALKRKKMAKK